MGVTLEYLLDKVIEQGKAAARRDYCRPDQRHKLRGALAGFDRCRELSPTFEYFEAEIARRHETEREMIRRRDRDPKAVEAYWEHRCHTAEVEYVFDVLKVAWRRYPLSGRAMMHYQRILEGAER